MVHTNEQSDKGLYSFTASSQPICKGKMVHVHTQSKKLRCRLLTANIQLICTVKMVHAQDIIELRKMKIEKAQGTIHLTGFNKNFVNEVLLD